MSTIKVNKLEQRTGCTATVGGGSGKTVTVDATTVTLGRCGGTVSLASGATQTGFGRTGTVNWCTTAKTSPLTVESGKGYFINTTSGVITVTLPSSPSAGDIVSIKDYAGTFSDNNVTIGRGGSKLAGGCLDATLSTNGDSITLVFVDATQGWLNVQTDDTVVGAGFVAATGGCVATSGNFKIHTFNSTSTFVVSNGGNAFGSNTVDYLVVGAGGGGAVGEWGGGGGGAGGYRESSGAASGCYSASPLGACVAALPVTAQTYPVTIGAGGAGGTNNPYSTNGDGDSGAASVFSTISSAGGGGAGGGNQPAGGPAPQQAVGNGKAGGSGGGGSGPGGSPVSGSNFGAGNTPPTNPSQGNNGGKSSPEAGGSGGGAGAVGGDASGPQPNAKGGNGGNGVASSITGSPVTRGGGAGGSGSGSWPGSPSYGQGGTGGGANAQHTACGSANAGTANTGGGGGGTNVSPTNTPGVGGAGGSGVVIIRYKFQ
mgnify:FL=1